MLKIISWLAWALVMFMLCIMDISNGNIALGVLAGLCGIMDICLFIFELRERKRLNKLEAEWKEYLNEREDT